MNKLAVNGGKPIRNKPWPTWPIIHKKDFELVDKVLRSGKWWYGEKVREFEERFASFQDARYGITTTNGTAALEIALICAGIGAGDEVIIPPYTFVATVSAVLKANAIPIFVDIDEDTFNIDPDKIEGAITKRTKAIIPVHIAGLPCDMDRIINIAKKHNLKIIEDACHSWGSKWKNKGTGALGDAGAFSFQMSKNITSGEGGIILTDNKDLADLCRAYTNCGRKEGKPWYEHYSLGGNYRMTEIQAAILLKQLERLEEQTNRRAENARYLSERLNPLPFIELVTEDSRVTRRAYHLFVFKYIAEKLNNVSREKFLKALNAEGIPAAEGYYPLYKNPLFATKFFPLSCPYYGTKTDYTKLHLPVVEKICAKEGIWFIHSMLLGTKEDMGDIVKAMKKIRDNIGELKQQ